MIITLGKFIKLLEQENPEDVVIFDFGNFVPTKLQSYRGDYSHLAFGFERWPSEPPTVMSVLSDCKSAVGKTFTGYKGGDFVMREHTPLWVSEYGDSAHTAVCGLENSDLYTVIKTEYRENL